MSSQPATIVVIGGANVDVLARSAGPLVQETSNPGHTVISAGGVGRNIAENIARLGTPVRLVSVVGADPLGDQLLAGTAAAGVDVSAVRRSADHPTGTYTALLAPDGELSAAVASMAAIDALGPDDIDAGLVDGAALVVLDGNLAVATAFRAIELAGAVGVPVIVDPVSVPKALRLSPALDNIAMLTPNRDEIAALTGTTGPDAVRRLHDRGIERVWMRLGADGSILSGPEGAATLDAITTEVVDVTGAGDAMLGAYCHAISNGEPPVEAARFAHAAAALTISSPHTVRPDLTDELVRSLL